MALLEVKELCLEFIQAEKTTPALKGVNICLHEGETLVLAGESGSGKSITALSCTRNLPHNARITSGSISYRGRDVLSMNTGELRELRGKQIAYIFQDPTAYLNPLFTIGNQICEAIRAHEDLPFRRAMDMSGELLERVKISDIKRVLASYPHQLSGGMNQRVFIAMGLALRPEVLIADEPTTSLDVTIEAEILRLLSELKKEFGFSLIFITHNLSIAGKIADRVCIMHEGRVVEEGCWLEISVHPVHEHTKELMRAYEEIGKL